MNLELLKILLLKWNKTILNLDETAFDLDYISIFTGLSEKLNLSENQTLPMRIYHFLKNHVAFTNFPEEFLNSEEESLFVLFFLDIVGVFKVNSCDLFKTAAMKLDLEDQTIIYDLISTPLRTLHEGSLLSDNNFYSIIDMPKKEVIEASQDSMIDEKVHKNNLNEIKKIRKHYESQLLDLENQVTSLKKEVASLEEVQDKHSELLKEKKLKIQDLIDENTSLVENNAQLSHAKEKLSNCLLSEQHKLQLKEEEIKELNLRLSEFIETSALVASPDPELLELRCQLDLAKKEIEELKAENSKSKKLIVDYQNELFNWKIENTISNRAVKDNLDLSEMNASHFAHQEVLADILKKKFEDIEVQTDLTLSNLQRTNYDEPDQPPSSSPNCLDEKRCLQEELESMSYEVSHLKKSLRVKDNHINDLMREIRSSSEHCNKLSQQLEEIQVKNEDLLSCITNFMHAKASKCDCHCQDCDEESPDCDSRSSIDDLDERELILSDRMSQASHKYYSSEADYYQKPVMRDFGKMSLHDGRQGKRFDQHWPDETSSLHGYYIRPSQRVNDMATYRLNRNNSQMDLRSRTSSIRSNGTSNYQMNPYRTVQEKVQPIANVRSQYNDKTTTVNRVKNSCREAVRSPTLNREELQELFQRNKKNPRHLQTSYPIMTQRIPPDLDLESYSEPKRLERVNSDSENIIVVDGPKKDLVIEKKAEQLSRASRHDSVASLNSNYARDSNYEPKRKENIAFEIAVNEKHRQKQPLKQRPDLVANHTANRITSRSNNNNRNRPANGLFFEIPPN